LIYIEQDSELHWGSGMIQEDPLFVSGPLGDFYLSHQDAGPLGKESPCVDAGKDLPGFMPQRMRGTTRIDGIADREKMDMGYHYPF